MRRSFYRFLLALSVLITCCGAAAAEVRRVEIADPARFWRDQGFVELTPAIRVSVAFGARTVIYVKIPEGARLTTRYLPEQQRYTIRMPPGSASDRVALMAEGETWTVEDVRGTSWDSSGREYFHVYRPATAEAGAKLVGYQWPRGDLPLQDRATELLTELVRDLPMPFAGTPPSWRGVAQFRSLNACGECHVPDKQQAISLRDPLPPWMTDASGIYVPLAVLGDRAVLSTTPAFHDPNAADRFVQAGCSDGSPATEFVRWGRHFFRCGDGSLPIGRYDLAGALEAGDAHAERVCASRRYLYDRLDAAGRQAFAESFKGCAIAN